MKHFDTSAFVDKAISVSLVPIGVFMKIMLENKEEIQVPLIWFPRVWNATTEQRAHLQLVAGGRGIRWPELDEDISIEGILHRMKVEYGWPSKKE